MGAKQSPGGAARRSTGAVGKPEGKHPTVSARARQRRRRRGPLRPSPAVALLPVDRVTFATIARLRPVLVFGDDGAAEIIESYWFRVIEGGALSVRELAVLDHIFAQRFGISA